MNPATLHMLHLSATSPNTTVEGILKTIPCQHNELSVLVVAMFTHPVTGEKRKQLFLFPDVSHYFLTAHRATGELITAQIAEAVCKRLYNELPEDQRHLVGQWLDKATVPIVEARGMVRNVIELLAFVPPMDFLG